ncbi:MAG: flagellar hook-basal body complex protein [Aquabacterium sp.]|nr:MAG: flagellar hook-basal body complex protein [Aquabacterium sp.]
MLDSLYISAIGMQSQKTQLDAVANNMANANTPGYKRERVDFVGLMNHQTAAAEATDAAGSADRTGSLLRRDLSQGEVKTTGSALDLAINGAGFIEVRLSDDRIGYMRGGSLRISPDGFLSTSAGQVLRADIRVPSNASGLAIAADGTVTARLGSDTEATELGRIEVAAFSNPEALNYRGDGVYELAQDATDAPVRGTPGTEGLGALASGKLEMSNVKLVDEMVSLMMAQRVYELNSRVAQAADELMGMANNLRRS